MGKAKLNKKRKVRKKALFLRPWFLACATFSLICLIVVFVGVKLYTKEHHDQADGLNISEKYINNVEQPSFILDRNGDEFGRMFVENRHSITIEEVPQKMIHAVTAGEDSRFFTHGGVDYIGLARATILNIKSGAEDSGASTITMQLARNAFDLKTLAEENGQTRYDRKITEIFLAKRIEEKYTKSQILEFYINRVNFGKGFYGIRSAALGYFGKEPKDLEVYECASLVGCIKNPSVFNPVSSPERNKKARDHVLNRMQIEGMITDEEYTFYVDQPVVLDQRPIRRGTSHFYDRVADFVESLNLPEEKTQRGGLRVFTTIDKNIQKSLETKMRKQLTLIEERKDYTNLKYKDYKINSEEVPNYLQGAALAMNHRTGEILAYVGGRDFNHSQYDFIKGGTRPLGTAYLPFLYLTAIEQGIPLGSPVIDEAMDNRMVMVDGVEGILAEWGMEVEDPIYEGKIPARKALEYSKIAASVRLGKKVGLRNVDNVAKRFNLSMPYTENGSRVLPRGLIGSEGATLANVASAYGAIANGGEKLDGYRWVSRIETANGELLYNATSAVPQKRVISRENAFIMNSALKGVWKNGNLSTAHKASSLGLFNGGAKSGTSFDFADNWGVCYAGDVTIAAWAGIVHGSRKEIYPAAFAADTVMPICFDVLSDVDIRLRMREQEMVDTLRVEYICSKTGLRATSECHEYKHDHVTGKSRYISTAYKEYFSRGTAPSGFCDLHGGGGLSDTAAFSIDGDIEGKELLYAVPIRSKDPVLLGDDPYNLEKQNVATQDRLSIERRLRASGVKIDYVEESDFSAQILHERPGRIFIDE